MFNNARLRSLNRIRPSFKYLIRFDPQKDIFDPKILNQYVDFYKQVVRYFPDQYDAHGFLGIFYYYSGDYKNSESALRKAVGLNEHNFWHYHNLGGLYFQQKRYKEALDILYKSVFITQDDTFLSILASPIYQQIIYEHRDFDNGKVKRLFDGYRRVYTMLIFILQEEKNYLQMFNTAYGAVKSGVDENGIYLYFAGLAAFNLKEFQKAAFLFQESIKKNSNFTESYYYLGLSYEKIGKIEEAKTAAQRAVFLKEQGIMNVPLELKFYPAFY
ncbi:MAG: tetratricopeptide repeat protein [Candidatus Omnitrophica bacterium]|nr:tetratricopeptide repeat protein [Candidatus Omnitrophota bacterium]